MFGYFSMSSPVFSLCFFFMVGHFSVSLFLVTGSPSIRIY